MTKEEAPPLFAMVSVRASRDYTLTAIDSFFGTTTGRKLTVIDNDGSLDQALSLKYPLLEVTVNSTPKSFAENMNQMLSRAEALEASLYFLNNDLLFLPGWLEPLEVEKGGIVSPMSNREVQYEIDGFKFDRTLDLTDIEGRLPLVDKLLRAHRSRHRAALAVLALPFFCIKVCPDAYRTLGPLDVTFGVGGAEDSDYCMRAALARVPIRYAPQSFVIHFNGKSTWCGAESPEATRERCDRFRRVFASKWGTGLTELIIDYNDRVLRENPLFTAAASRGDLAFIVETLVRFENLPLPV